MSKKKRGEESMKEEDNILRKVGAGNSFKAPEGYFENLTSEVMNRLPEREKSASDGSKEPTMWERVKPWTYMAAMFIGAALIIRVASTHHEPEISEVAAIEVTDSGNISDQYINAALDGSMMDDYSLYVYLSDAGEE